MTAYPLHLGLNWSGKVVYITAILLYALFIQCVYFPCNVNLIFMKKGPWTRYNVTIFFSIFGNFINYTFVFFRDVHTVSVSTVLGSGIPETVKCLFHISDMSWLADLSDVLFALFLSPLVFILDIITEHM